MVNDDIDVSCIYIIIRHNEYALLLSNATYCKLPDSR
jgi:hypothetical protein